MRILVVEDEKKIAEFLRKGLKAEGYAVDVAPDGEEGHFLAGTQDYDLIILDLRLPKMDGLPVPQGPVGRVAPKMGDVIPVPPFFYLTNISTRMIEFGSRPGPAPWAKPSPTRSARLALGSEAAWRAPSSIESTTAIVE